MAKKTIITAAVTGAWPKKENNPNVPMTPSEIADDVYACWKAGAAIAHIHMRDDEGNGAMDPARFAETVKLLKERYPECDIIIRHSAMEMLYGAVALGGHIRVGMEDNVMYSKGVLAESNAQFVERAARVIREYGNEVATPAEAREMLRLAAK